MESNWMDETVTETSRAQFDRYMQALQDRYPEIWDEALNKFGKN